MSNLRAEIRHSLRLLRRRPGFGLTITATIALAIAGNTVMVGLVGGILLSPLPLPGSEQLVRIEQVHATGASNVTGATFVDVRARTRSLSAVAAIRVSPATFSANGQALQIAAATVTADYFPLLRLPPAAGRLPAATDFTAGAEPVVFLSRSLFQRVFNGERQTIGQRVLVNAAPRTVAGVIEVPPSTPGAADVWLAQPDASSALANRRARLFTVIGRLDAGVTTSTASAELAAVAANIAREAPQAGADMSLRATPLRDRIVQPVRGSLLLLWAAVGVLTLIAFSNVANLLLMEGSIRERELAVRAAIGAPRAALIRQLAIEARSLGPSAASRGRHSARPGCSRSVPRFPRHSRASATCTSSRGSSLRALRLPSAHPSPSGLSRHSAPRGATLRPRFAPAKPRRPGPGCVMAWWLPKSD